MYLDLPVEGLNHVYIFAVEPREKPQHKVSKASGRRPNVNAKIWFIFLIIIKIDANAPDI